MKILVLHNLHRKGSSSGDDQVFKDETRLLEEHGHSVIRYTISNDSFDKAGIIGKIKACLGMMWSFKSYKEIQDIIRREKPDIVHAHTFFPLMSPSVLYAAKRNGCKVVATLHDTRFICPCCTSLRGTTICNECGDGHYLRMFKYGCFKGSRIQSLIVAFIFKYHRIRRSFYNQIDKYICLNDNQIRLLEGIGFDKKKIVKKYNFVSDSLPEIKNEKNNNIPERYVVFYGRIGEEKGIRILMKAWENMDLPLVVMGSGPLEEEFRAWADKKSNVYFLGYTAHQECLRIVRNAEFVVFPSIWYEGCSMVQIETMSLGKVLVATNLGFSEEAIEEGYNGTKFELGDVEDFIRKIQQLWKMPERLIEMGQNARKDFEEKYLPEDNYNQLIDIYKSVLKEEA
ncbi:Glycosyltransferase involved in cell wall bisynthesis [Butyrivibrio fibrisolvens DSM 3071]|uniref:Glycosyltransferase involved in cell wall bisynthesis n=1 Tax=Butyrivibrio fibrisolvens DSM 3071 TaxID=1121131 RepID=A0A1M6FNG1_BUTFI|nr:glycosyltransferase family 4 protein [Butyrivibrio fibrisolvens]SHI99220.1 Glycosyltransferase involved in cell wall bisynthesis [Butyrivibrio fibrisolvens DSM 3071]